ncbi:MAG: hypothetical protein RL380_478 [Verrucomicrobiota bacterium]|jgi:hypothetical protein
MQKQATELQQVTARRLARLRGLSVAELNALPEAHEEVERIGKREIQVATYRDVLPDGRLRIMVQAYLHRVLGIGSITADGFIIASDGSQSSVPQEMVWEFV